MKKDQSKYQRQFDKVSEYLNFYQQVQLGLLKQESIKELLTLINKRVNLIGIPYLIHLHHTGLLDKALNKGIQQHQQKTVQKFKILYQLINQIFPNFLKCIAEQSNQVFAKILKSDQEKMIKSSIELTKNIKKGHFEDWKDLLDGFLKIKKSPLNIHEFNEFIDKKLRAFKWIKKIDDIFCMNWLKNQLEKLRKNSKDICCKLLFFENQSIQALENTNTQFKKYFWPIKTPNIEFHLKKTIVGFLNASGGIIYIGVQENEKKINTITGMELTKTQLGGVYKYFKDLVKDNVLPSHPGFEIESQNQIIEEKNYKINQYMFIEFMPVLMKEDLFPIENKYIVKLFVKIGHPKHLYHIINNQNMIDFYIRQDRKVEKKPFPDAYKMIYEKLEKFEAYKNYKEDNKKEKNYDKYLPKRQAFHNDCRYLMDDIIIDIDPQSDSDDD